jgi:hypothetical protein
MCFVILGISAAISEAIFIGTTLTEATKEERIEIIKALDFGYTGHFLVSLSSPPPRRLATWSKRLLMYSFL